MATIRRSDWGAGPHRAGTIPTPVQRLFLHHTVTPEWTGATAAKNLQQIARNRGFVDISYSWLVDKDGNQIEGRGWGRQGAHTVGWNSTAHAISLIGNFDANRPSEAMINATAALVRKHGNHGPGKITHGHRDVSSTACPGRHAYALIGEINRRASGSAPTPPPTPSGGDEMFCKKGDTGHAVGVLQLQLRELGFYKGEIDNDYGPKTSEALLAARKSLGSTAESGDHYSNYGYWQVQRLLLTKFAPSAPGDEVPPLPDLPPKIKITGTVEGTVTPSQ